VGETGTVNEHNNKTSFITRFRWTIVFAAIPVGAIVLLLLWGTSRSGGAADETAGTFAVHRSDLTVSVTESGDIKALNSKDIRCEVEGKSTIINIVPEGTYITPEDVNKGKILVELDSSAITAKVTQQELEFSAAQAGLTEAEESLEIQKQQNASDIQTGEMKVRFTAMDLQKYLGEMIGGRLITSRINPADENDAEIDRLVADANLGGEALQKLRDLDSDIYLKEQNLELSNDKFGWTEKLYDKKYISFSEREADRLDREKKKVEREQAKTARDLFVRYQFSKDTEKLLSDYQEAKRELERVKASARSKLAQAQAKLQSAQATYKLKKELLEKAKKQLDACVIKAPSPGQVVYSSSMLDRWQRQQRLIEVGGEVRERQSIISIPDPTVMKAEVKIHENWIDKIQLGQKTSITIAAFPDKVFSGKVLRKSPMADQTDFWNADLKVYTTDVGIEGTYDFLKTGMTGKVEIIIEELRDVISVPIQTVINIEGKKYCYVVKSADSERREVQTGVFNTDFVEIKSGLSEGEKVLLNPPRLSGGTVKSKSNGNGKQPPQNLPRASETAGDSKTADNEKQLPQNQLTEGEQPAASSPQSSGQSSDRSKTKTSGRQMPWRQGGRR
jgi:HlyD family secretion protein